MSSGSSKNKATAIIVVILIILLAAGNISLLKSQGVTLDNLFSEPEKGDESSSQEESVISFVSSEEEEESSEIESVDSREKIVLEHPYYIKVDKGAQIVTVYTTNEEGKYEKVVRQMLCSTGAVKDKLPDGYYPLKDGESNRKRWGSMFSIDGSESYAQYCTRITGYFLFHSVTYSAKDVRTMHYKRFNNLGKACSGGCIRLTVENAKWIYENCNAGTVVEICSGEAQPELVKKLQEELGVGKMTSKNTYDPTDPEIEGHITQYPDPDPEPDPYAELYDYNIKFSPECGFTRGATTTTPTTTASTTVKTTTPTTAAPNSEEEAVG